MTANWNRRWPRAERTIGTAIGAGAVALSIALLALDAPSTPPPSTPSSTTAACCDRAPVLVGQTYGEPVTVDIDGDRAAVVYGGRIVLVDVAIPTSPRILGYSPELGALPFDIDLVGDHAYLAGGAAGVHVVDVRDPGAMRVTGHIATAGTANAIVVDGPRAYVADGPGGLAILDVADPGAMRELGRIDTPGDAVGVAVDRGTAYVADFDTGLQIVDVGDPVVPWLVASLEAPRALRTWDVALLGERAILTTEDGQLWSVHVDLRSAPRSLGLVRVFGDYFPRVPFGVFAAGDKIVASGPGLYVLDSIAVFLTQMAITRRSPAAAAANGLVAALDEAGTLYLYDAAGPRTLVEVSTYALAGDVERVAVADHGRAVAAGGHTFDRPGNLRAVDVADPAWPRPRGWIEVADPVHDVAVVGRYAIVAAGSLEYRSIEPRLLTVYDVNDPDKPRAIKALRLSETPREIVVAGDIAYVAMGSNRGSDTPTEFRGGVRIYDIAALPELREIALWIDDDRIDHLALAGDRLYLAGRARQAAGGFPYRSVIHVMDVSNPAKPQLIGTRQTILANYAIELTAINAAGSTVFVSTAPGGRTSNSILEAFDASDPAKLQSVGTLTLRGTVRSAVLDPPYLLTAMTVYSETLRQPLDQQGGIAASDHSRLDVIDVGRPEAMAVRSQALVPLPGVQAEDLFVDGGLAYMATGGHGLWIFDIGGGAFATPSPTLSSTKVPIKTATASATRMSTATVAATSTPTPTSLPSPTSLSTASATLPASPASTPPPRWHAYLPDVERTLESASAP